MLGNERFFNTVGAINPKDHYFLPHRLDWNLLKEFIEKKYYFILHAPRQSGKTTSIIEFVKHLNQDGIYKALYISCEQAHPAVNDVKAAMQALLEEFMDQLIDELPQENTAIEYLKKAINEEASVRGVYNFLRFWSQECINQEIRKPLVLFFDEFDGLVGDTLISLLKQFRSGYTKRPEHFPQTICLIGVRDLRDYKVKTKEQEELGVLYSPFNIKAESLVLANFSKQQVRDLYLQHTKETNQQFTEEALDYAFEETGGQPWLVNALAYQACFRDIKDRSIEITKEILKTAKEALILRQDTHIDALIDRLKEPRVYTIMDAILSGNAAFSAFNSDDVQYVRDLGLISLDSYQIANPIYREIFPRALIKTTQEQITQRASMYQA